MPTLHEKISDSCWEDSGRGAGLLDDEPIVLDEPITDVAVKLETVMKGGDPVGKPMAIVDIHVPFWSLIVLMLKAMFAFIPAFIVFLVVMNILSTIGLMGGIWGLSKLFLGAR